MQQIYVKLWAGRPYAPQVLGHIQNIKKTVAAKTSQK